MGNDKAYTRRWYAKNRKHANEVQKERRALYGRKDGDVVAQRKRTAAKKRLWLNELKAFPCTDCHTTFPPECMDWDHIRGKKLFCVGYADTQHISKVRVLREIAKCELVCANCHRIRTTRRMRARSKSNR